VFSLNNRILLRGVNTIFLVYNATRIIKIKHFKFHGIIRSDCFDIDSKLCLNYIKD